MQISTISWPLVELLEGLAQVRTPYADTMISGMSLDSRSTKVGDLFFATQGLKTHGLEFSQHAIANGAAAIAWEPSNDAQQVDLPRAIPCIPIPALQQQVGLIAKRFYGNSSKYINIIGVTGTDGKTSVSQFIAQALNQLKISCGVIGTLGNGVYPDFKPTTHTTPNAICIQALLRSFFEKKITNTVIEASSHGLKQGRLNGVNVDTAVFTNLGRDHMDYHPSLKEYGNSKSILFKTPNLKNAVINVDDAFGCQLAHGLDKTINIVSYSCGNSRPSFNSYINAPNINFTNKLTKIEVNSSWGKATIETKLYGKFNVSNILATMAVLLISGCSFTDTVKAVSSVDMAPGRMERVNGAHDAPTVIIDYAHTPQALTNVLQVLRDKSTGKLWCVFGCGGDRDSGKRNLMANAVEQFADYMVVTDDNPRTENPASIAQEIILGFSPSADYSLIHDRRQAIAYAIRKAARGDTILITGKGHEAVQIINDTHIPFDDKKIATTCLKNYQK